MPFLHIIWSTPTNLIIILKPLDELFTKNENREMINKFTLYGLQVSRSLKLVRQQNWASNALISSRRLVFTSECSHYSRLLFHMQVHRFRHIYAKVRPRIDQRKPPNNGLVLLQNTMLLQ